MYDNELTHWGVRGMKWGVRRYQNKDGTLTPRGKKRYDKEMDKLKAEEKILKAKARTQAKIDKLEEKRKSIEDLKKSTSEKQKEIDGKPEKSEKPEKVKEHKDVKKMTDAELQTKIDRMNLEKRYSELMSQTNPPKSPKGKSFVLDTVGKIVPDMAVQVGKYYAAKLINGVIGDEAVYANNKKK